MRTKQHKIYIIWNKISKGRSKNQGINIYTSRNKIVSVLYFYSHEGKRI
jgi:hypothetical protein